MVQGRKRSVEGRKESFSNNSHFGEEAFEKRTEYVLSYTTSPFSESFCLSSSDKLISEKLLCYFIFQSAER